MITYMCQNYGICDVLGQILKRIHQASYQIEWKIANSAKANIEASFKHPHLNPKNIFQKIYSLKRVWNCFLVTYHIKLHFSWKFYWNSSSFSEDMNFCFFDFNYFCHFFVLFLPFLATKKLMMSWDNISSFLIWNYFRSYWPTQSKLPLKSPALKP